MYRTPLLVLVVLAMSAPVATAARADAMETVAKQIETKLGVFIYPKGEQDASKQANDTIECYDSAKERSGIDPQAPPPGPEAVEAQRGGAVRGAARGAAAGAAIGAAAGDAGAGAGGGAAAGAMRGRRQQKQANAAAEQQAQEQAAAAQAERMATFNKAFSACMDARNYSVK